MNRGDFFRSLLRPAALIAAPAAIELERQAKEQEIRTHFQGHDFYVEDGAINILARGSVAIMNTHVTTKAQTGIRVVGG